uniref:Uncharacterized protein n=1 Tax=Rhodopseudomonas palustris (strain DX-1) TaxID=652103 RepID=E6VQ28_RHOPX
MSPNVEEQMPQTPESKVIETLLNTLEPAAGIEPLERAMITAFPAWEWNVKDFGNEWLCRASVVDPSGATIADDADAWLDTKNAAETRSLLKLINELDLRIHRFQGRHIYAIGVNAKCPTDFVQVRISVQSEATCSLRGVDRWELRRLPDEPLWHSGNHAAAVYRCDAADVVRSLEWLERCKAATKMIRAAELERFKRRIVKQQCELGAGRVLPFLDRFPELVSWNERMSNEERWFRDWEGSSAGKYPMGHYWYLQAFDYVADGGRNVGFIPQFVVDPKRSVATIPQDTDELMNCLHQLDAVVNLPFAWFFYMVHGNRVSSDIGHAVAKGVRLGQINLALKDQAVVIDWDEEPYHF